MPEIFNIEYVFKVSCLKIDLFCYFKYFYQIINPPLPKKKNPKKTKKQNSQAFINQRYEIKIKSNIRMVY